MITDAILNLLDTVLSNLLGLLPIIAPPDTSGVGSALGGLFQLFGWLNWYLPLDTAGVLIGLGLAAWAASHVFAAAVWVLTKLHILGGSS